jgi:CRP/FNR family cyclic AMP-dependent transcriptional regulator
MPTTPPSTNILGDFSVFAQVDAADLDALEAHISWKATPARWVIMTQGDSGNFVYFLRAGRVQVTHHADNGRMVELPLLGPGALFGELSAIDDRPHSATVIARTACRIGSIGVAEFSQLIDQRPSLARALLRHFAGTIRDVDQEIPILKGRQRSFT